MKGDGEDRRLISDHMACLKWKERRASNGVMRFLRRVFIASHTLLVGGISLVVSFQTGNLGMHFSPENFASQRQLFTQPHLSMLCFRL